MCVTASGVSFTFKFVLVDFLLISFLIFLILLFGREKNVYYKQNLFYSVKIKVQRKTKLIPNNDINKLFNRNQFVDVH